MNDTFTIEQEFGTIEFINLICYQTLRTKILRRIMLFVTAVDLMLLVSIYISAGKNKINWYEEILGSLWPLIFILCFFIVSSSLIALLMMKIKPNNYKGITYTFTHWGMDKRGKEIEHSRQWSNFLSYHETKHFILLYITRNDAHVIQKRMFKDIEEQVRFIAFISKYLNKK